MADPDERTPAGEEQEQPAAQEDASEEPAAGEPGAEEPGSEASGAAAPGADEMMAQIRAIKVGEFVLSTVSTLASLAYAKLEARELDEARGAIDAIRALLPVLEGRVETPLRRDFERALANLQVAYADAAAG